jgi:flagellar M-ring protein FliF
MSDELVQATNVGGPPVEAPTELTPDRIWQNLSNYARGRKPPPVWFLTVAAIAVSFLFASGLWLSTGSERALYGELSDSDRGLVVEALDRANVPYRIESTSGVIYVDEDAYHHAKIKLAAEGLPRGGATGFEALNEDSGFGISHFMEKTRFYRALEGEISRSIRAISSVRSARVHLAIPKDSVFVRRREEPSASVLVELEAGRVLGDGQVRAIIHLVASSVPRMSPEQVSVVDQFGSLMTGSSENSGMGLTMEQLAYRREVEKHYIRRIVDIVVPVLGTESVRAQVSADLDFSETEETAEQYDPKIEGGMVRSERLLEDVDSRIRPEGVPGALSNEPPATGVAPEVASGEPVVDRLKRANTDTIQARKENIRNYELDKRTSRKRNSPGKIKRISVAVVLDDRVTVDEEGVVTRTPLSKPDIDNLTALIKQAVGFDEARGDTADVVNFSFAVENSEESYSGFWKEQWFLSLVRLGVTGLAVIVFILIVARPLVKKWQPTVLTEETRQLPRVEGDEHTSDDLHSLPSLREDNVELRAIGGEKGEDNEFALLEAQIESARTLVAEDPKRTVQIVKNWLDEAV